MPLLCGCSKYRNLRLIRIEAGQAYTADRHRPVTTEHGRLHERSRLVAPHFHNAFLCVHLQGAIVSCG